MSAGYAVKTAALVSAALGFQGLCAPVSAGDFTAKTVMEKMEPQERAPYLAGVVEGLAYARYARDNKGVPADKKTTVGMECIYDWFYKDSKSTLKLIYAAFDRYGAYPPGAVIAALEKKSCGE